MSIVKYDIPGHISWHQSALIKKKVERICAMSGEIATMAEKVSNCVCLERMREMLSIWWNTFFPGGDLVSSHGRRVKRQVAFLFIFCLLLCDAFYLRANNEKIMNKFQWFSGISTMVDGGESGQEGEKRMKVNYNLRNQWHFEIDFNNTHQLAAWTAMGCVLGRD